MTTNAISGLGTKFYRLADSVTWTLLAEIKTINASILSRETIAVVSLVDVSEDRNFIGGARDSGTISLSMLFTRTNFDIFFGDYLDGDLQTYRITLPDNTELEFQGIPVSLDTGIEKDSAIECGVEIKVNGVITLT